MKKLKKIKLANVVQDINTRYYSKIKVTGLMESIQQEGLLQPIGVTTTDSGKYTVVYGNRRFQAMKKLGWLTCDAYVYEGMDGQDVLITNMTENTQREDVTAFEEGHSIYTLVDKHGLTTREIAIRLCVPVARVKQSLQLFQDLPPAWRDKVINYGNTKGSVKAKLGKGTIPASTAALIVRHCKENNLPKAKLDSVLKAVSTSSVTTNQAKRMVELMAGNKDIGIKDAKYVAAQAVIVRVSIPITLAQLETYKSKKEFSKEVVKTAKKHMKIKDI